VITLLQLLAFIRPRFKWAYFNMFRTGKRTRNMFILFDV